MIHGVYMSNENPSNGSVSSTLKEVVILSGEIESLMCRRGTFKEIDVQRTIDNFRKSVERYDSLMKEIRGVVLLKCDEVLGKLEDGRRAPLDGLIGAIVSGFNVDVSDIKMCSKFVESVILEVTTVNDAKARYFRVVKGRDNGICMFDKRYKY